MPSSRVIACLERLPSGQIVLLWIARTKSVISTRKKSPVLANLAVSRRRTYMTTNSKFSILSTSMTFLAAWMMRLLAAWLTHGAPVVINGTEYGQINLQRAPWQMSTIMLQHVRRARMRQHHFSRNCRLCSAYLRGDWWARAEAIVIELVNQILRPINWGPMSMLDIRMSAKPFPGNCSRSSGRIKKNTNLNFSSKYWLNQFVLKLDKPQDELGWHRERLSLWLDPCPAIFSPILLGIHE